MEPIDYYRQWLASPYIDLKTKGELKALPRNEIEDRFYKPIEFGTGGVRGILGAGRNRINQYTIRCITQGLANYINSKELTPNERGVVIAYDSRNLSKELALETAITLLKNGIHAYLFNSLRPTPLLSFSVRELKVVAGIMITASHNPPEYNGYKVYWKDGGQIVPSIAKEIMNEISKIDEIIEGPDPDLFLDKINWLNHELDDQYISRLKTVSLIQRGIPKSTVNIVYTPLHGAGKDLIQRILKESCFSFYTVPEQEYPDPEFSTVILPNPEEKESFELAIDLASRVKGDIVLATDPDCDRVGLAVLGSEGRYVNLTGNQIGALLLDYILLRLDTKGILPENGVVIKTIVTSEMGELIAKNYGLEVINTLTGFKYIGEQIQLLEERRKQFLFGYEESCGYLTGTFVRDKDGVMATFLICEMAAFYKSQNKTLLDVLENLYLKYGYFIESLESVTLTGKDGLMKIQNIMESIRLEPITFNSSKIVEVCDYLKQEKYEVLTQVKSLISLPRENALKVIFDDGSWYCVRPSGTEPKIKIYFATRGDDFETTDNKLKNMVETIMKVIHQF